jgi:hypothetical protein
LPTSTSTITPQPTATFTPTATPLPTDTPTITPTINPAPNASIRVLEGNFTELRSCSGTVFSAAVGDPEGVARVYIEFSVAYYKPDFSKPDQVLELTNVSGDTWSGTFEDHVSRAGDITYWRVVVVDKNGVLTTYYENGRSSFYSGSTTCT